MQNGTIGTFLWLLPLLIWSVRGDLFSYDSSVADWDHCDETADYTDVCEPTISIEQAACEAPSVVYARVLQVIDDDTQPDNGDIEIQVNYRSQTFGEQPKGIPKWGAGLENEVEGSIFNGESGFFTTWVTGFNNTPSVLGSAGFRTTPCGTQTPIDNSELYLFLAALPENAGPSAQNITISEDTGVLSVNFTLSTDIFHSGYVPNDLKAWDVIRAGIFNDNNRLKGDCEVVYCCYNPDCEGCDAAFAKYPSFQCEWAGSETEGEVSSSWRTATIGSFGVLLSMLFGVLGELVIGF